MANIKGSPVKRTFFKDAAKELFICASPWLVETPDKK